ncbi:MAG: lmo0937 family membrane protein [Bacteroidetes bacterium]|nr:lmo0937 family membrane protein [Bacteroidota bacterium]
MKDLLYIIAAILFFIWAIGFFAYNTGGILHILLIVAVISIIIRIIQGKKVN